MDSYKFAIKVLKECKVIVIPGGCFGPHGEGYIRLGFTCKEKKIKEGMDRLIKWW